MYTNTMHTNEQNRDSGVLLWRAANAWQRAVRAALRPHAMTQGQFLMVQALAAGPPPYAVIQRQAAACVGLDAAAASTIVRQVQARGWVAVRGADDDARAKVLSLTAAGRAIAATAQADVDRVTDRFFGPLRNDRSAFTGALAVLVGMRPRRAAARKVL